MDNTLQCTCVQLLRTNSLLKKFIKRCCMGIDLSTVCSSLKFPGQEECISSQTGLKHKTKPSFPLCLLYVLPITHLLICLDFKTLLPIRRSKSYYDGVDSRLTDFFFWGGVVDTGNHTFQGKFGCELRNNTYCKAFWRYAYDRRDYIKFNTEIPAWIPLQKVALNTKVKWEKEGSVQAAKNYLEDECPQILQRYLQYSKNYLDRQGTHCSLCSIL